jgi:hypothetical protein
MLPKAEYGPAGAHQECRCLDVAGLVAFDLVQPPSAVGNRRFTVFGAAVPEAAIDEHGQLRLGEGDVDRASRRARNLQTDAVPQPSSMQQVSDGHFRVGVAARVDRHPMRHGGRTRGRPPIHRGSLRCRGRWLSVALGAVVPVCVAPALDAGPFVGSVSALPLIPAPSPSPSRRCGGRACWAPRSRPVGPSSRHHPPAARRVGRFAAASPREA